MPSKFWKNALINIFETRDGFNVAEETDDFWVIQDKYPKGKLHLLIVPKVKIVKGVTDLTAKHLSLLQKMKDWVSCGGYDNEAKFLVGFHAIPSLFQLHLHIVSTDLRGCKTKKHRNSFTKDFMLCLQQVIEQLEETGHINVDVKHYKSVLAR